MKTYNCITCGVEISKEQYDEDGECLWCSMRRLEGMENDRELED